MFDRGSKGEEEGVEREDDGVGGLLAEPSAGLMPLYLICSSIWSVEKPFDNS